jgi:hypothetical protein
MDPIQFAWFRYESIQQCIHIRFYVHVSNTDGWDYGCFQLDWHALPITKGFKLSDPAEFSEAVCSAKYCNGSAFIAVSHDGICLCAEAIHDPMHFREPCDASCFSDPSQICSDLASNLHIVSQCNIHLQLYDCMHNTGFYVQ